MNKNMARMGALVLTLCLAGAASAQNRPGDDLSTMGPEQRRELQEQLNQRAVPYDNRSFGRSDERRMDRRVDRRSAAERRAEARRDARRNGRYYEDQRGRR